MLYAIVGLLGLCVGSFLNVVIYRVPKMMEAEFKSECEFYLGSPATPSTQTAPKSSPSLTLSTPASHCPSCGSAVRWFDNIPLISWLVLAGKCRKCQSPISTRYPLVELVTALLSLYCLWQFGPTLELVGFLGLIWSLIALTGIDFDHQLLPDRITLPLAAAGLLFNAVTGYLSPVEAIWGYVLGFLSLWLVYKLFLVITGKEGMGYGDFKLLAALGAWLGVSMLPLIVISSASLGAIVGIIMMRIHGESRAFAFGPALAIGGIVALFFGQPILDWYLGMY